LRIVLAVRRADGAIGSDEGVIGLRYEDDTDDAEEDGPELCQVEGLDAGESPKDEGEEAWTKASEVDILVDRHRAPLVALSTVMDDTVVRARAAFIA
jgi:hypothetical protein